ATVGVQGHAAAGRVRNTVLAQFSRWCGASPCSERRGLREGCNGRAASGGAAVGFGSLTSRIVVVPTTRGACARRPWLHGGTRHMLKRILLSIVLAGSIAGAIGACSPAATPSPSLTVPSAAPSTPAAESPSGAAPSTEASPSAS